MSTPLTPIPAGTFSRMLAVLDEYANSHAAEACASRDVRIAELEDSLREVVAYCDEAGHHWMCLVDARSLLARNPAPPNRKELNDGI